MIRRPPRSTLFSLHDALPISRALLLARGNRRAQRRVAGAGDRMDRRPGGAVLPDRKSTRLNSSHGYISYAVFCLKKKNKTTSPTLAPSTLAWITVITRSDRTA